jgi:hypothetical protein
VRFPVVRMTPWYLPTSPSRSIAGVRVSVSVAIISVYGTPSWLRYDLIAGKSVSLPSAETTSSRIFTAFAGATTIVQERAVSALVPYVAWTARTRNVCAPIASGPTVRGLVHAVQVAAVSRRHWNVAPETGLENANVALVSVVGLGGPEVMVGAGSGVIVHAYVVSAPEPNAVRARTRNVWLPSGRFV